MFVFSSHTRPANSETSTAALTTPALDRRSLRWFGISAPTATPQDVTIRRGWFASTLTVQTVQGAAFKVRGLNRHQASYVRCAMLDAAAVRAAAAAQELVKVDEALHRLLQRGRYVRHSEMLAVHEKLVSAVQQCGGLITRHLPASVRDALGRLVSLESAESVDAVREDVNQRCVSASVPAVAAAADAALGARVTEEQAEAVATDEDVTLVLAGAGTGKTTVIAAKVAHLVLNERVDPVQILVLAFNKKAQREIVDRLTGELSAVDVETFHAFGRRVVADSGQHQPSVSKMATDDHTMRSAIDEILNELIESDETSELVAIYLAYHFEPCLLPFDFDTDDDRRSMDHVDPLARRSPLPTLRLGSGAASDGAQWCVSEFDAEMGSQINLCMMVLSFTREGASDGCEQWSAQAGEAVRGDQVGDLLGDRPGRDLPATPTGPHIQVGGSDSVATTP